MANAHYYWQEIAFVSNKFASEKKYETQTIKCHTPIFLPSTKDSEFEFHDETCTIKKQGKHPTSSLLRDPGN